MKMEEIKNVYFKLGKSLMSGCNLPERVTHKFFKNCDFHPNCEDVEFVYCTFENCDGIRYNSSVKDKRYHNQVLGCS